MTFPKLILDNIIKNCHNIWQNCEYIMWDIEFITKYFCQYKTLKGKGKVPYSKKRQGWAC